MTALTPSGGSGGNPIHEILLQLVSKIPASAEAASDDPQARAKSIAQAAALKAAGLSGALALPPGPLALVTILPDLLAIWHIQQQMVADIAATFGKKAALTQELMIFCLFRHGASILLRDIVVRVSERVFVRRVSRRVVQQTLQKIGVKVTQRVVAQTASRWVPVIGAVGVGTYAYFDTRKVAATAIDTFSREISVDDEGDTPSMETMPHE